MAHSNRSKNKARREVQKRARREANQAHWSGMAGTASNRKKKNKMRVGYVGPRARLHLTHDCGNLACKRCYPQFSRR